MAPTAIVPAREVYDPATEMWSPTAPLATERESHTATLLPTGKVLVIGGYGPNGYRASAEEYDDTGAPQEWRPVITSPAQQYPGEVFHITGSRLQGLSEASSGNTQSSATNLPIVSFLALEGGTLTRVTSLNSFSNTQVSIRTPFVPNGYYILSAMANAIHGGQLVLVNKAPPSIPIVAAPESFVNTSKPVIGGTAEPGNTVLIWLDGAVVKTTQVGAQGQWSFTPESALGEGQHGVMAMAKDMVGNVSLKSEERGFFVDTVPPGTPSVTALGSLSKHVSQSLLVQLSPVAQSRCPWMTIRRRAAW